MSGTVVAFHTTDPLYRAEAERMRRSADRLGIDTNVEQIAPSSWLDAVRSKVGFLMRKRESIAGPLLYVDVDAIFHGDPWALLEKIEADVSFALLLDGKARSGTIYLADSSGAREFLADWQERLAAAPEAWDQHPLNAIASEADSLPYAWTNLPGALCFIFDRAEETVGRGVTPVIEHLQASRDLTSAGSAKQKRRQERIREIDQLLGSRAE